MHNALGFMQRLKSEGAKLLKQDSKPLARWERGCDAVLKILTTLGVRRDKEKVDLQTVMREFFQEFEHATGRLSQTAYGALENADEDPRFSQLLSLIDFAYLCCTYAIVSAWIPDKQDESSLRMHINLSTGKTTDEWTRKKMRVPRNYKKATKQL